MQIKTIYEYDESIFDEKVNQAIREGWKVDLSTYRVVGYVQTFQAGITTNGRSWRSSSNSIILTREY